MIQLPDDSPLAPLERYGLEVLVDLSRLIPLAPGAGAEAVRLQLADRGPPNVSLSGAASHGWYLQRADGAVTMPRKVIALLGAVAAGDAEQRSAAKDRHGRVPPSENPLVAGGLERDALVSRAAAALKDSVVSVAGQRAVRLAVPWPEGRRWAVGLTHDLDLVDLWPLAVLARSAELVKKRRPVMAAGVLSRAIAGIAGNPVWRGVQSLLDNESGFSVHSTWFIICETPTWRTLVAGDVTYRPESPRARRILSSLTARGCEVGLHGSFVTARDPAAFQRQRDRLGGLVGAPPAGIRQHFLRLRPGETHVHMKEAGFQYDSSCGFPDRNGFRVGVADVLPAWDSVRDKPAGIEEAPFCWMDRALSKYRDVEDPEEWVTDGLRLAAECRSVEGLWVGVWHPNMHPRLGFPGAADAFERLVAELAADHPFFGSLGNIVRWRVARRGIRARGVQPDGTVDAGAMATAGYPLRLEDASGRPREAVQVPPS